MHYTIILFSVALMWFNSACTGAPDTLKFKSGIRSILQDSKGNYWFGSDQEGVCRFDGKRFSYYTPDNGFCGNQVIYIKEDKTGLIWFGTSSGLCSFDGRKFTAVTDRYSFPIPISDSRKYDSWAITSTDLWFPGSNNHELIRIDNGKSFTIKYPIEIPAKGNRVDYGITGFSKSKKGGLWVAHYSGVGYYDGQTFQFISDSTLNYDGESKYLHVRSILEDSRGRLWIGNNGIGILLKEKDSIIPFSIPRHIFVIKEDSKGNIWFGDRDTGAWRYDGKEMRNFVLDSTLNSQHIWDIYEDRNGNLLFASGDRGVYQFNGNGFDKAF